MHELRRFVGLEHRFTLIALVALGIELNCAIGIRGVLEYGASEMMREMTFAGSCSARSLSMPFCFRWIVGKSAAQSWASQTSVCDLIHDPDHFETAAKKNAPSFRTSPLVSALDYSYALQVEGFVLMRAKLPTV